MVGQHKGIVVSEPIRGVCFAEDLVDHISVFVPLREVVDSRYLHLDDIITFDLVDNPRHPGKFMATNIKYAGHSVARQVAARKQQNGGVL